MKLTGQTVDLSRSDFNIESLLFSTDQLFTSTLLSSVNFNSTYAIGTDTNGDWDPGIDLLPTEALSSYVPVTPFSC